MFILNTIIFSDILCQITRVPNIVHPQNFCTLLIYYYFTIFEFHNLIYWVVSDFIFYLRDNQAYLSDVKTANSVQNNGCGRTRRVNWVYFLETWLKILNNLTGLMVGYNKITGLHFLHYERPHWNGLWSGLTQLTSWDKRTKWQTSRTMLFTFSILFLCFPFLSRRSRLRQSLSLLMHTTQISKAVLSTMMLIV